MNETSLYLYIFSGPHLGAKIALSEGKYIVGSSDNADIVFFDQNSSKDFAIAPRHASINVHIEREVLKISDPENPNEELVEVPDEILQEFSDDVLQDIPKNEASSQVEQDIENLDSSQEKLGKILSISLTVNAIDGNIYQELGGESLDSFTIERGEAFYIASTCMVWNLPDQVQEAILPKLATNAASLEEGEDSVNAEANQNDNLVASVQNSTENEVVAEDTSEAEKLEKKNFIKTAFFSGVVALGLIALSVGIETDKGNITNEINYLNTRLADSKIENINVIQQIINGSESILLEGYVSSEGERQQIQSLARSLQYPVYLSVEVQNDLLRAVQDSFALYGIFPSLYIEDSNLHVDAYIQDPLLEEAAFATLNKDISDLPAIKRNIVHELELSQLINEKLTVDGIHNADTEYGKGVIAIMGEFTPTDKQNIHKGMNEIIDTIKIPLHYSLSHSVSTQTLANTQNSGIDLSTSAAQSVATVVEEVEESVDGHSLISVNPNTVNFGDQIGTIEFVNEYGETVIIQTDSIQQPTGSTVNPETGNITIRANRAPVQRSTQQRSATVVPTKPITISGLKINSIHTGNIPFLTTSEGQRLFVGAFLPNGFTLEKIERSQISIRKGTQRVTISLDR